MPQLLGGNLQYFRTVSLNMCLLNSCLKNLLMFITFYTVAVRKTIAGDMRNI